MTSDEQSTSLTTSTPDNDKAEDYEGPYYEPPPVKDSKFDAHRFNEEQRDKRRHQVWKMAVVDRMTQTDIGKALNISNYTVHHDLKWVEKRRVKSLEEADKTFVAHQDQIYEALLDKWLPIALRAQDDTEESFAATDKVTTALSNQAKLHGFGASGKVSPKQAGEVMGEFVLKAMREMAHGNVIQAEVVNEDIPQLHNGTEGDATEKNS